MSNKCKNIESLIPHIDFTINELSTGGEFKDVNITTDPQYSAKLKKITIN